MIGGEKEVHCVITLVRMEVDTGEERILEVPTEFYEAEIGVDAILSYEWLAMYDFMVNPKRNALVKKIPETGDVVPVSGNHIPRSEVAAATRVDTPLVLPPQASRPAKLLARQLIVPKPPKTFRMLELFFWDWVGWRSFQKFGVRGGIGRF